MCLPMTTVDINVGVSEESHKSVIIIACYREKWGLGGGRRCNEALKDDCCPR